jgi:SAM-dependent methyltransferase
MGAIGTGRRGVAPDGSPVEIYRNLPTRGEPELIDPAIPPSSSILELGCGTGRVTRVLAERGHHLVAIDNSADMLAALDGVPNIEPIEADIVGLDLGRRFGVVLAGSHLINTPAPLGDEFMATAARHVAEGGSVIMEAYPPGLDWHAVVGRRSVAGRVGITVTAAEVDGDRLDATVLYDLDGRSWRQPFSARLLDEAGLRAAVVAAGLRFDRWLDERAGWFRAVPVEER